MPESLFITYLQLIPKNKGVFTRSMVRQNPFLSCTNHFAVISPNDKGFNAYILTTKPEPNNLVDKTTFISNDLIMSIDDDESQYLVKDPIALDFYSSNPTFKFDFNPMFQVKKVWYTTDYSTMQNYLIKNKTTIESVISMNEEKIYFTNNFIEKTDALIYMLT
jgi:hypothetical protein